MYRKKGAQMARVQGTIENFAMSAKSCESVLSGR
jgi:hypothetical protein